MHATSDTMEADERPVFKRRLSFFGGEWESCLINEMFKLAVRTKASENIKMYDWEATIIHTYTKFL